MLPGDGGSCFDGISDLDSVLNDNPVPWPCTIANGKRASHLEGFLSDVLCNPAALQVTGREEKERYHRRVPCLGAKAQKCAECLLCFMSSNPPRHCCLAAGPWGCSLKGDPELLPAW